MDRINAKAHQRRKSGWIPGAAKYGRRKMKARNVNRKHWLRWRERNNGQEDSCTTSCTT